jgi:hypothetical protein
MVWEYVAAVVFGALAIAYFFRRRTRRRVPPFPYVRRVAMFSSEERAFLTMLDLAVGEDFRIFGKVRVADVLAVNSSIDKSRSLNAFIRIAAKHFDYVLCYRTNMRPVCAIELHVPGWENREHKRRFAFLARACMAAHFPLVVFDAQRRYPPTEVRQMILDALGTNLPFPAGRQEIPGATEIKEALDKENLDIDLAAYET